MSKGNNANAKHKQYAKHSIDFTQTILFVQTTQVGVGLFSLPRIVSEEAGHNGWIAVLIAGFGIQVGIYFIVKLLMRFENLDLYDITRVLFGKWLGNLIGILFALYCIAAAALVARSYVEIVQSWLFPTTNTIMFYILLMMPIIYCAIGGARVLGQFAVITFFSTVWMMILLIVPFQEIQTDYYRPLFTAGVPELMKATLNVSTSVIGFELLLIIFPFIKNKKKTLLAASTGMWMTTIIYLIVVLISIGFYSHQQILQLISPTLHLFKIVLLPLIERIEHIGIVTWSFLIVNTSAGYLWGAGRFLHSFGFKERKSIYWCVPLVLFIGLFPRDAFTLNEYVGMLGYIGVATSMTLPALLLLFAVILRKKGSPDGDTSGIDSSKGSQKPASQNSQPEEAPAS